MFGAKRLIDTPVGGRKPSKRSLQFTPVGDEDYQNISIRQENNLSPLQNKNHGVHRAHIADHTINGSSFDNTSHGFDTIASDSPHNLWNPNLNFLDEIRQNQDSELLRLKNGDLLSNGSNPLKQQHDNVSKLQDENLNLKVRLATLTRYFGEEPLDKRDLINNNIELKQSLIEMDNKVNEMKAYIKQLESKEEHHSMIDQAMEQNEELQNENLNLKRQLHKMELDRQNEIDDLHRENDQLLKQNEELVRDQHDLNQLNEDLEREFKNLQDELSGQRGKSGEIDELKGEIEDLRMQLRRKDDLDEENDDLRLKLRQSQTIYDELSDEIQLLRNDKRDLQETVENLQTRLTISKNDTDLQDKLHDSMGEIDRLKSKLNDSMDEIDRLNAKLRQLESQNVNENNQLIDQISSLQHQLDTSDQQMLKMKSRVRDLQKELQTLQELGDDDEYVHALERERQHLNDQLMNAEERVNSLNHELHRVKRELDTLRSSKVDNRNTDDSLQREINHLRHDLQNQDKLIREIEDLKLKLTNNDKTNPFLEQELKRLTNKNDELQQIVNSMSFTQKSPNSKLQSKIQEKDNEIDELKRKLKDMMRSSKLNLLNEDDEKLEMMKEISKLNSKLKLIQIEKDNLKEEYSMKLSIIKKRLDNESHSSINETLELRLQEVINSKDKILIELSKKQQEFDEIFIKNEKLNRDNKELEKIMFALEENENKLSQQNKDYERDIAKLKLTCVKLLNKLKNSDSDSVLKLKLKLSNANEEIDILTKKYIQMRSELKNKIDSLQESKQKLKSKLLQVSEYQNHKYPTPESSPTRSTNIATLELQLHKLNNFENQKRINDLQIYNKIINQSLHKTNSIIRENLIKIDQNINTSNYQFASKRQISFKQVALMVLASVRIRKRMEELNLNKIYINGLNKEIKLGKLNLI